MSVEIEETGPSRENLLLWVQALESGEYRQGVGRLAGLEDGQWHYCCLGVLCEVAIGQGVPLELDSLSGNVKSYNGRGSLPPSEVFEWLGVTLEGVNDIEVEAADQFYTYLAEANDHLKWDFLKIAGALRAKFDLGDREPNGQ